jgi:hypothetical protein
MKRELTLQLLKETLPDPPWSEDSLRKVLDDLRVLAEYKYNKYEMYQPARLFFENLHLFLNRFLEADRTAALQFVRDDLIFISREEFQQLAHVLYFDQIRQKQLDIAALRSGIPRHHLARLTESKEFLRIQRASLYVALSDGARIDYFRRQNLDINNEQVLAAYYVGEEKIDDIQKELRTAVDDPEARFECVFLLDDFCGSGRTLLREIVTIDVSPQDAHLVVPPELKGALAFNSEKLQLEWNYKGLITSSEREVLRTLEVRESMSTTIGHLVKKCELRDTAIKGSLKRIAEEKMMELVSPEASVFLSPLLITEYAKVRLGDLTARLPAPLSKLEIIPGATVSNEVRVLPGGTSEIVKLCNEYYLDTLADKHTSTVRFGYDGCGLPLVLHHNTPNNSLYFLWARKWDNPLFPRFERHGREVRR